MDMWIEFLKYFTVDNGLFVMLVLLGMLGHATKKFLAKELSGSIIDYVFRNNPKRTALALVTAVTAAASIILAGQIPNQVGAFIIMAFTTGFTADSSVNKDES